MKTETSKKSTSVLYSEFDERHNTNSCISLTIQNKSSEMIKDVSIFNYDYKEQSNLVYEPSLADYDYLLRVISSINKGEQLIKSIALMCSRTEQLNCNLTINTKSLTCGRRTIKTTFLQSQNNQRKDVSFIDFNKDEPIYLTNSLDLTLSHLNPSTVVTIFIYFENEA